MTNKEKLIRDFELVAKNHFAEPYTEDFLRGYENPFMCGDCKNNVPLQTDLQMLCESVGLPNSCIYADDFGVELDIPTWWVTSSMTAEWTPMPELWLKQEQMTFKM